MNSKSSGRAIARGDHPSCTWSIAPWPETPLDPVAFRQALNHPSFPLSNAYDPLWLFANSMGPICLWLAEDIAPKLDLKPGQRILDLGCGRAATSIFLAREFGVEVVAADLWIDAKENRQKIAEAGVSHLVTPVQTGANNLPFEHDSFDAVVSFDAYHYFGTEMRYLSYLSQFVRPGGRIGAIVPGNAIDPDDPQAEPLTPELFDLLGADWFTFRSAEWWRRHWSRTPGISVESAEMVPDGYGNFMRYLVAWEAMIGQSVAEQESGKMLLSKAGSTFGFARVVARRLDDRKRHLGIGEFEHRIA
jgi:SAM-dependent methyltransferase